MVRFRKQNQRSKRLHHSRGKDKLQTPHILLFFDHLFSRARKTNKKLDFESKTSQRVRFWQKKIRPVTFGRKTFYKLPEFELREAQRVRFWKVHNASDFEKNSSCQILKKKLRSVRFWFRLFTTRLVLNQNMFDMSQFEKKFSFKLSRFRSIHDVKTTCFACLIFLKMHDFELKNLQRVKFLIEKKIQRVRFWILAKYDASYFEFKFLQCVSF